MKKLLSIIISVILVSLSFVNVSAVENKEDVFFDMFSGLDTAYNNMAAVCTATASSTGKNGLRVYNKITEECIEDYNIVEYGSLVAKHSNLDSELSLETPKRAQGIAYNKDTMLNPTLWEKADTYNVYTAYLTGIPEEYYNEDYVIRAYAIDANGKAYYGKEVRVSVFEVVKSIDEGNGKTLQTEEDKNAFDYFAGKDSNFAKYDSWLKENGYFSGRLRNMAKAEDVGSPEEITEALEVDGYYEPLFKRAIANEGNLALLKKVFEKAERIKNGNSQNETLTIVGFGGSITAMAACTRVDDSYSYLVKEWFETTFDITVNYQNAGIGATSSVLGVARMGEQVLDYSPDLVLLDFTTNDQRDDFYGGSYEAILRTLIQNDVAVVTIAFGNINNAEFQQTPKLYHRGENREAIHGPVMLHNDVPVIDYYGVMWDCYLDSDGDGYNVDTDLARWANLWADYIHPTVAGHKLAGNAIIYYLNSVYNKLDTITDVKYLPEQARHSLTENFMGSKMYQYNTYGITELINSKSDGVTTSEYINYDSSTSAKWYPWNINQGQFIEFSLPKAKVVSLLRVQGENGGTADIYINGSKVFEDKSYEKRATAVNWMNYIEFFDGTENITLKIQCTSGTYYLTTICAAMAE